MAGRELRAQHETQSVLVDVLEKSKMVFPECFKASHAELLWSDKMTMKIRSLAILSLTILCASCVSLPQQPPVKCDGLPSFCLVVANELDSSASIMVDGTFKAYVAPGEKLRIPFPVGASHLINYCHQVVVVPGRGLLDIGEQDSTICNRPVEFTFNQNASMVIYANSANGSTAN